MQQSPVISQFLNNPVVAATFCGWLAAQTIKVVIGILTQKKFDFRWFVGTGGMPSSHTAGVAAMATAVGLYVGVGTALFGVTLMFTVVVICDAQGVRRATGQQATTLNKIIDDIYWNKGIKEDRLKELIGHTPIQVFAGIAIGMLVAYLLYRL